ncbi:hypothetical protein BSKO_01940 [Bryopsis sp. KO-2023]|nr:hypothetical protein BSKO_01940 [Bryopsis sp. KO-2023]
MPHGCPQDQGVTVPQELLGVRATALEEYVRARLNQFAHYLWQRVAPQMPQVAFENEVAMAYTHLPAPQYGQVPLDQRELQLVFRHDCLALGCTSSQCSLCQHNPNRRCRVNFDRKYLVGDMLKAKCGAVIRVEVVDRATGQLFADEIPGVDFEMSILDGNTYDQRVLDRKLNPQQEYDELSRCVLAMNNKQSALLSSAGGAVNSTDGKVVAEFSGGKLSLPDLSVTDSSEALLSGRKPPFRLLVTASDRQGRNLRIRHAVSEGFVVATRRTRTAGKVEIPSVDDHVSKLEHMGKETVKKLNSLRAAAESASISLDLPDSVPDKIVKVGQFRWLAQVADQDGTFRQKLQQVLKLNKEKWDDARDHAMKAVVPDNRMRAWYSDHHNHNIGLLFTSRMGMVDLDWPVALLHRMGPNIEATLVAQLDPHQREQVRLLRGQAVQAWWKAAHPGWSLCPYDSEKFRQTEQLETVGQLPELPLPSSPEGINPPHRGSHPSQNPNLPLVNAAAPEPHAVVGIYNHVVIPTQPGLMADQILPYHQPAPPPAAYEDPRVLPLPTPDPAEAQPCKSDPEVLPRSAFHNGPPLGSLPGIGSLSNLMSFPIPSAEYEAFMQPPSMNSAMDSAAMVGWCNAPNNPLEGNKIQSLELPDVPDINFDQREPLRDEKPDEELRRSSAGVDSVGRDASTGLDSMQSIEHSLGEVQRSLGEEDMEYVRKRI